MSTSNPTLAAAQQATAAAQAKLNAVTGFQSDDEGLREVLQSIVDAQAAVVAAIGGN